MELKTSKDCDQIANRHAFILKYKSPFIRWDKKLKPWREPNPRFRVAIVPPRVSLFIRKEKESYESWLKKNYKKLFEEELFEWEQNRKQWPKNRTYNQFRKWFEITFSDFIIDEDAGKPIEMI
jgi:hypothetical protein